MTFPLIDVFDNYKEAEASVNGYRRACHKGVETRAEGWAFIDTYQKENPDLARGVKCGRIPDYFKSAKVAKVSK